LSQNGDGLLLLKMMMLMIMIIIMIIIFRRAAGPNIVLRLDLSAWQIMRRKLHHFNEEIN